LTELYRALRLYIDCFQPSMKLLSKQREGKKVRYVYDPARTPLQRLLLSNTLPAEMQQELLNVAHALDPIHLIQEVEQLQQAIFRCAVGCSPFIASLALETVEEQWQTEVIHGPLPISVSTEGPPAHPARSQLTKSMG
jgi:hypothetical protein